MQDLKEKETKYTTMQLIDDLKCVCI